MDYEENTNRDQPIFYSSLATRLGLQYLLNLDVAPGIYYRLQANATYPSAAGWRLDYTYYNGTSVLNRTGRKHGVNADFYYPFFLKKQQFLTQLSSRYQIYPSESRLDYRGLVSTGLQRIRMRLGYRAVYSSATGLSSGLLSPTPTYTTPCTRELPDFFRGMYFRTELQYRIQPSQAEQIDFQILKSLSRKSRYRFTYSRNLLSGFNSFELTFSYDFDYTRSTSSLRTNRNSAVFTQTFRGSVGYDSEFHSFALDNRQQVGRSAASIRMFVDSDDSGTLDSGEEQIQSDAIRVRNTTGRITQKDSIARLTQLQSYRRYNLEVNESQISNPAGCQRLKSFLSLLIQTAISRSTYRSTSPGLSMARCCAGKMNSSSRWQDCG
ncbi:MAG: hypothetical protein MAGBODY4_01615 [Candidatus Marinimicrobia bacterium]|nr:hypothetical protein [Candidatus Neomarinimicrobiota bacterium]